MLLNMDQLEKQLDKEEFQETRSMAAFRTKEGKVDTSKALYASLVITESSGTEFRKYDTSSRLGNDADADDAYIRSIYDEEPMDTVQTNAENNIFPTAQQHAEQPEFNNKGKVDQNAEQCHEKRPLIASLTDRQHGQFLKAKSNEAKVKNDIDVIETIKFKLEHKVAKLLKEDEHLKAQI
ncbi:hypothetical protein Tco_0330819 [Tanacetum coccineum]